MAQGVGDQVAHRLFEPARIGEHLVGVRRHHGGERDAGGFGVALVAPHDVLEDPLDCEHPRLDRRRAVLVPGQVEQVGDDVLETFGFAARGFEIARPGRRVERDIGHRQRVEVAAHRGQRRAQLVRHVGEHLPSDPIGRVQRVGAGRQLGRHPVEGAGQDRDLVATAIVGEDVAVAGADAFSGAFERLQPAAHRQEDHRADQRRGGQQHQRAGQRQQPADLAERPARGRRRQHDQAAQFAGDLHRGGHDRSGRAAARWRFRRCSGQRGGRLGANRRRERRGHVARLAAVREQDVDRLAAPPPLRRTTASSEPSGAAASAAPTSAATAAARVLGLPGANAFCERVSSTLNIRLCPTRTTITSAMKLTAIRQ